jgi:aminopeptidase
MRQTEGHGVSKDLSTVPFDPELTIGARNAIGTCLRLMPSERITIITDEASVEIAASLAYEVSQVGAKLSTFVLEECGDRPLRDMPSVVLDDLAHSQVSIYAAMPQTGELRSRMQMTDVVNKHRIRHGHMVHISKRIMCEGMRADFARVDELSSTIIEKARSARTITATTPAGTHIEAEFSTNLHWIKTSGIISPDKWGNLPGGEVFTCPENIKGVFVVDGVVGDYLCRKYGDVKETPLRIELENSRIASLACDNAELLEEFRSYTSADQNSNRVGEFAIGTNLAVRDLIGEILQDEKFPGVHIAFGHPYAEHTGAKWTSTTHIDCVGRSFDIKFDGQPIMRGGKFLGTYLPRS